MAYIYGYHRTSTTEQHLDRGIREITDYCEQNGLKLEKIFTDQQTGKNFDRPRYTVMRDDVLKEGDTLIVSELDRLGRNREETLKELRGFKDRGIRVMVLELPTTLMDLSGMDNDMAKMMLECINDMMIDLYASIAQSETEKRAKRQREGIEAKKARGEWDDYGRPHVMPLDDFRKEYERVRKGEIRPTELMRGLGMTKSTFYSYCKKLKQTDDSEA